MHGDLEDVLLTEQQIQSRLDVLATEIAREYTGKELTVVGVLTGSVMFMTDLLRRLPLRLRLDYVGVSSYHGTTCSTGQLVTTKALQLDVHGREVLVLDDILDTGLTLIRIRQALRELHPGSLRFGVLLEKDVPHRENFTADYVGFKIPDKFVVGYGLDYREQYRNLPYVGTLKKSAMTAG